MADDEKILEIIREELTEIKERFNDKRRTEIVAAGIEDIEDEDLIPRENIVISLTHNDYIKRAPVSTYRAQKRGGRGIQGMGTNEDDFVEHLITTSTHDTILFFTNKGKVYRAKGYEIPEYGRTAKGLPIINLLGIEKDEWVNLNAFQFQNLMMIGFYSLQPNMEYPNALHFLLLPIFGTMG